MTSMAATPVNGRRAIDRCSPRGCRRSLTAGRMGLVDIHAPYREPAWPELKDCLQDLDFH